jgi:hypothetical protein
MGSRHPEGISSLLYGLEFGDMIRWEAGGWRRSQPLKVTKTERKHGTYWVKTESNRGTEYYLKNDISEKTTEDTEYGEVTWFEVVDREPHF